MKLNSDWSTTCVGIVWMSMKVILSDLLDASTMVGITPAASTGAHSKTNHLCSSYDKCYLPQNTSWIASTSFYLDHQLLIALASHSMPLQSVSAWVYEQTLLISFAPD
ncbi:hypothetical protein ACHAWO_012618 [Cyclotella atomus]|uniref:Uncharacterized protein n=1 Tax=Cyclotella atomus TaxID=382360 RepID=A0ABD3PJL0_9STRA